MMKEQQAAAQIMRVFVERQGGDTSDIYIEDEAYRWKAPDGRIAAISWKGSKWDA